eukprot:TRINITY_DN2337_c0_g2_i1.p2 TRINITY_DN2337_c0_g2~~TRINITY_DN2337_c0_g2_i1.p2  ORF type:complete len:119 (-),score=20.96 TRINITY_DN2337_c0_g2_i1:103-459(-)
MVVCTWRVVTGRNQLAAPSTPVAQPRYNCEERNVDPQRTPSFFGHVPSPLRRIDHCRVWRIRCPLKTPACELMCDASLLGGGKKKKKKLTLFFPPPHKQPTGKKGKQKIEMKKNNRFI